VLTVNSFSVASIPTSRFRIVLLFTTNHNLVTTKDFKSLGTTHLHYKLELMSMLKQSFAVPGNQIDASAVEAAYVLAITEVILSFLWSTSAYIYSLTDACLLVQLYWKHRRRYGSF